MGLLFRPFGAFIAQPVLAPVVGGVFAVVYAQSRRAVVGAAAIGWVLYAPSTSTANDLRITSSGERNIRVDVLLIAPILAQHQTIDAQHFSRS